MNFAKVSVLKTDNNVYLKKPEQHSKNLAKGSFDPTVRAFPFSTILFCYRSLLFSSNHQRGLFK